MTNPIPLIKALAKPDQAMVTSAVNDWLDDHPEATTTVQDGTITKAKLATALQTSIDSIPAVDDTLATSGAAADAKKAGDEIAVLKSAVNNTVVATYSKNLFNPNEKLTGKYLNVNGTIEDYESTMITSFMPVVEGKYATFSKSTSSGRGTASANTYLFYDANKDVINGSGSTWKDKALVPAGAAYIRVCIGKTTSEFQVEMTDDGTFTSYVPYSVIYALKDDIIIPAAQVVGITDEIETVTVKGTNLATPQNSGIGAYFYNGSKIVFDPTYVSYAYVIAAIKPDTIYSFNVRAMWWILADDDDNVISYGNTPISGLYFNSGNATKLYYTMTKSSFENGFILSEGFSGVQDNIQKPVFVSGISQLMRDSWFAVALPRTKICFTVGIDEKLYFKNILALENNTIKLWVISSAVQEDDGVVVNPTEATAESNVYRYWVYDENLSLVAQLVLGQTAFSRVYADAVDNCSALMIGDSITARSGGKIGQTMLDAFTERNKTLTLLGTLGTGDNKHEGRAGWSAGDYFTDKQYEGVTNPFYNPSTETFDFSYYMTNQNYSDVDYVIIHLGANDLYSVDFWDSRAKIKQTQENLCAMIDSILAWNPNQKILIELAPTISSNSAHVDKVNQKLIRARFVNYNAETLCLLTKYANVRCSNDYMILDPATDLSDQIHPTDTGLEKIGMELVSQINCWQQDETGL